MSKHKKTAKQLHPKQQATQAPQKQSLIVYVVVMLVIVGGGIGAIFALNGGLGSASNTTTADAPVVAAAATTVNNPTTLTRPTSVASRPQLISPVAYHDTFEAPATDHVLIDVRTREEFAAGAIEGAINIPVEELASRLSEVPTDQAVVVYCRSGNRSATAANILNRSGFGDVYDLGGIIAWQQAGYPLQ